MSIHGRRPGREHVGVALAPDALVIHAGARTQRLALAPATAEGWPALADALRGVRTWLGGRAPSLDIALVPPLVQTRTLVLPRLRPGELERVVRRDAASHFPVNAAALVIGVRGARVAGRTVAFAIAADLRLVQAMHAAAREAGFAIRSMVAAESAWIAAAREHRPAPRGAWRLMTLLDDRLELLQMAGDTPTLVRRLPRGAIDQARLASLLEGGAGDAPLRLIGDTATAFPDGFPALDAGQAVATVGDAAPESVAARWAHRAAGPRLVTDDERASDARAERRRAVALAAAAAVLVVAGGALGALATHRDLARVEALRAAIRPRVQQALATRDSVARAAALLADMADARRSSPRWSGALASLAARLPADAHLLSIRADGDSLTVEGVGASASTVLASLRDLDGARAVRASSPITQETGAGGALVERFALTIALAAWDAPPSPTTSMVAAAAREGTSGGAP